MIMCFSKYKQTCVCQYGSVLHNRQMATSSKTYFFLSVQQLHRQGPYTYQLSTRASVWSYIVANVYENVGNVT